MGAMSNTENLIRIQNQLPQNVTLVAVSKTRSVAEIMEIYNAGQRIFGENKVQEMTEKWRQLPKDIQWHHIGHVQRNKIKYMGPYVTLLHGIDSLAILEEVDRQAAKHHRRINCLLQVRIAQEETKFGMTKEETLALLASDSYKNMQHASIVGLMGMASFTEDTLQIKREFLFLKALYDQITSSSLADNQFRILSMGMSGDYQIAIACGSTMVRIGSSIFGART